jgi:tetratricopeptide (TPR) repeat protein
MERLIENKQPATGQPLVDPRHELVGRDREIADLLYGVEKALAGQGQVYLIAGEPGIGKTRLAKELASRVLGLEVAVLWGRSWDAGGAQLFWPWRQIIRECLSNELAREVVAKLGASAQDLSNLAPEVMALIGKHDDSTPLPADPEQARLRVFDSATRFFELFSRLLPLTLIFENLHAADLSSLLLLRFAARNLTNSRVMIVGTHRDAELSRTPKHAALIGEIASEGVRISLSGLAEAEVGRLFSSTAGHTIDARTASEVREATNGNPLFVIGMARSSFREGIKGPDRPGGTRPILSNDFRAVVLGHAVPLSEPTRKLLSVASVFGRDFDAFDLGRLADISEEQTFQALNEALAARIVVEAESSNGNLRFHHPLLRDALYDEIAPATRAGLHVRLGTILAEQGSHGIAREPSEIAHHFVLGIPAGSTEQAVYYARQAAELATLRLAYEEAERFYKTAVHALRRHPVDRMHCELMVGLGEAQYRSGNLADARTTLRTVADEGHRIGAYDLEARAALGIGMHLDVHVTDTEATMLSRRVLDVRDRLSDAVRAELLGQLARNSRLSTPPEYREQLIAEAMVAARNSGQPRALLHVLNARRDAVWGLENIEDRIKDSEDALRLAKECGDREAGMIALRLRIIDECEQGNMVGARNDITRFEQEAAAMRQPFYIWEVMTLRTGQRLVEGRFDEAERLANEALAAGRTFVQNEAMYTFSGQFAMICRERSRLQDIEPAFAAHAEKNPDIPLFRCTAAYVWAELDRYAEARREFEDLARENFATIRRSGMDWLHILVLLSELCCYFGDKSRAETLRNLLAPFADRNATYLGLISLGSVAAFLGKLEALRGRFQEAAAHFEHAIEFNDRIRARPWLAEAQYEFGRMLSTENSIRDRQRAVGLLASAREIASSIGSVRLLSKIDSLDTGRAAVSHAKSSSPDEALSDKIARIENTFRRQGEYWTIVFQGRTTLLRNTKGLEYIAILLANPDCEFHAIRLASAATASVEVNDTAEAPWAASRMETGMRISADLGDAGEALDATGKFALRSRIQELRRELPIAKESNDFNRVEQLETEIEWIESELGSRVGLRGRSRRDNSPSERARVNVTRTIRTALETIAKNDAELGMVLSQTIRTGTFCCYVPDPKAAHQSIRII